ncbi:MAG TPA: XRE family transcriptional regulator [Acidiferrobacteraceae bacterium]|nr:XRE family transcriptional regulator [Acidiferrobacteraceae bacterium]
MNVIRLLRTQAGLTQQELAARAGTSQPAIASYESAAKSPTLATLQRLAFSVGLDLAVTFVPHLTREDHRSLAYHRVIAEKLSQNSISTLKQAKRNLSRLGRLHPGAKPLFTQWHLWLALPIEELKSKILDPGIAARDMRQVSPFSGLLQPQERVQIIKQFRKEYGS